MASILAMIPWDQVITGLAGALVMYLYHRVPAPTPVGPQPANPQPVNPQPVDLNGLLNLLQGVLNAKPATPGTPQQDHPIIDEIVRRLTQPQQPAPVPQPAQQPPKPQGGNP